MTSLSLRGCHITDKGIPKLKKLKYLETLCLAETKISPDGLRTLKTALPRCRTEV